MTEKQYLSQERPLVTFAVFAYNQEKYIREAVEGAFSQTYEPLEIILSDDCSSDRTFEIMQEMAAAYRGPHSIITNRNKKNIGTIDHIINVSNISTGSLMIVAAGDDISYKERSHFLASRFFQTNALAIYSNSAEIDDNGVILNENKAPQSINLIQEIFSGIACARRYDGFIRHIPGYSAAYAPDLFKFLPINGKQALNEDALSTVLVNVLGGHIEYVPVPLLKYRLSETSTSPRANSISFKSIMTEERRVITFSKSSLNFYPYLYTILNKKQFAATPNDIAVLIKRLNKIYNVSFIINEIWSSSIIRRLSLLLRSKNIDEIKIIIPRLFGLYVFVFFKMIFRQLKSYSLMRF